MKSISLTIRQTPLIMSLLVLLGGPAQAQDLGSRLLPGLQQNVLAGGAALLHNTDSILRELLAAGEEGQSFASAKACLGALQLAVNAGSIASTLLPFSSMRTFEDERGPVGRFRLLLNGEKFHLDAFCRDAELVAAPLPWGEGTSDPALLSQPSLDARSGMLYLLQAEGNLPRDNVGQSAARATAREALPKVAPQSSAEQKETSGPPLTDGEQLAFRKSIQQCWNVGSLSPQALRTAVTVGFELRADGRPDTDTITMISSTGGNEAAARQTYESARRAIIRCGAQGFDLPPDKFQTWKRVAITFDPDVMRIR